MARTRSQNRSYCTASLALVSVTSPSFSSMSRSYWAMVAVTSLMACCWALICCSTRFFWAWAWALSFWMPLIWSASCLICWFRSAAWALPALIWDSRSLWLGAAPAVWKIMDSMGRIISRAMARAMMAMTVLCQSRFGFFGFWILFCLGTRASPFSEDRWTYTCKNLRMAKRLPQPPIARPAAAKVARSLLHRFLKGMIAMNWSPP